KAGPQGLGCLATAARRGYSKIAEIGVIPRRLGAEPVKDVLAILEVPGGEAAWGFPLRLASGLDCAGRSRRDQEGELRHPRRVVAGDDVLVPPWGNVLARRVPELRNVHEHVRGPMLLCKGGVPLHGSHEVVVGHAPRALAPIQL